MLRSLRTRLLWSYIIVLILTVGMIGAGLVVFLRSRPLPTDSIVTELAGELLDVRAREVWRTATGSFAMATPQALDAEARAYLDDMAIERDVRMMIVHQSGLVLYDSSGAYDPGDVVRSPVQTPLLRTARLQPNAVVRGELEDPNGDSWVFVAQLIRFGSGMDAPYLVLARPVPMPSLRDVFDTFGDTFLRPLVRAGFISVVIAIILSALIARSITRGLHDVDRAARRMADGDLSQRIPVKGPREVRTVAQSFNQMAQRVATTQEAQRDFLANVSHDLRTPLTSIQGFSQAITEGVASEPESAARAAQIIHDEAARMHRMVEGLLDLARLEADQSSVQMHPVKAGDILQTVLDSMTIPAQEKGVRLTRDIARDLPRMLADGDRLAQVFTNLIDNAIRHTPAGGEVSARARHEGSTLVVTVQDTGEGIPPEDLARIFERFYQVDKSRRRRQTGAGLGLSIVQQVIQAHGGTIDVASAVGEGTVFTIKLPVRT